MRCAIVGSGSISAAGLSRKAAEATYRSGKAYASEDAITGLPVFRVPTLPVNRDIDRFTEKRPVDRTTLLALHAAAEAVAAAGWSGHDFAILVGCSRGPTQSWESTYDAFQGTGVPPLRTSPLTTLGSIPFALADYFGSGEVSSGMSVTCSSGLHAVYHGMALLAAGLADRVLVGGTEAPLTPFTLRQMERLKVYASPGTFPCRPLADPPSGMVLGEGAAFLALERAGDAPGYVIDGIGLARERHPSPTGISDAAAGLQAAMRAAIRDGSQGKPDVVFAHAPGTKKGDAAEQTAIREVLGNLPVTSLKWATGHTFGASGPLAVVAALSALERGAAYAMPFAGGAQLIPETGLSSVLVNATGFGGNAISLLVRRPGA